MSQVLSAAPVDRAAPMRRTATGLLALMAGLFGVAHHFAAAAPRADSPWGWLLAFSEAALVGGCADWFAVTALFRHPLGLPIPHTAIVPANKDRIADTMAAFLRANFLTPQVVARRLAGMNIAAALGGFLIDPARSGEARLRRGAVAVLGDMLESLAGDQLGTLVKSALRGQLEKLDLAPLFGNLLGAAIADGRHRPVLEALLRRAGMLLEDNEDMLRTMIHERANALLRWTGLDERLANSVLDGAYRLLAECIVDPQHPLRLRLEDALRRLAHDLMHDPAMADRVARIKRELLANPAMAAWLDALWLRGRAGLLRAARDPEAALSGRLGTALASFGDALHGDARLQLLVNRLARRALAGIATRHGGAIVTLVSATVKRWDARTVARRLESAVGRDLQFIRINGTLVGGLIGLALHLISVWG